MSLPHYNEVYDNFDAAALEAEILDGRLDSGLACRGLNEKTPCVQLFVHEQFC